MFQIYNTLESICYKALKENGNDFADIYLRTKKSKCSNLSRCHTTNKYNQNQGAMTNPRTNRHFYNKNAGEEKTKLCKQKRKKH
jgi:hypothetical protein